MELSLEAWQLYVRRFRGSCGRKKLRPINFYHAPLRLVVILCKIMLEHARDCNRFVFIQVAGQQNECSMILGPIPHAEDVQGCCCFLLMETERSIVLAVRLEMMIDGFRFHNMWKMNRRIPWKPRHLAFSDFRGGFQIEYLSRKFFEVGIDFHER